MGRPRDHRSAAQDMARELADMAGQLATLKGEAHAWLVYRMLHITARIYPIYSPA